MGKFRFLLLIVPTLIFTSSISTKKAELKMDFNYTDNYYTNIKEYFRVNAELNIQDPSHELKQLKRDIIKWWPRLAPSGSISTANQAINAYNCNYNYEPSKYYPNWKCVGPTGKPEGAAYTGIGQMHRITFDPNYDGVHNHTIYAVSNFGGVWKSSTKKAHWKNLNTDKYLPFTTVADIAVHPVKTQTLLIATGDGDYGRIYDKTYSEVSGIKVGPTQTSGVYRSTNGGETWHKVNGPNNSFCNTFNAGGNTRKIIINPHYPDHAYIATTKGIFLSTNITASPEQVQWTNVLSVPGDTEFRGLVIKPDGIGKTVYASGSDIYKSIDGGVTWNSMTSNGEHMKNGLNLDELPYDMSDCRINIAATKADPDRLYAYIFGKAHKMSCEECKEKCKNIRSCQGCQTIRCWGWTYVFKNNKWHKINENNQCGIIGTGQRRWLGIAASPVNPNNVYFGTTNVIGNKPSTTYEELLSGESFMDMSGYNSSGFHADVHALEFEPKNAQQDHPHLYAATHGGLSYNSCLPIHIEDKNYKTESQKNRAIRSLFKKNWKRIDRGLSVATMHDMDQSYFYPQQLIVALQDNGVLIHKNETFSDSSKWKCVLGGDGFSAMFDANTNNAWIRAGKVHHYNYGGKKNRLEHQLIPDDPKDGFRTATRKFISRNHPTTGRMYTAFGEIYERTIINPSKASLKDEVWKVRSDIGKVAGMAWERDITDFKFAESNGDFIYVVSAGANSLPPKDYFTESRLFRTTWGGCNGLEGYGDPNGDISCFEHISTDEIKDFSKNDEYLPMMKSVAVHNLNPNKVWVAFSGYDPNVKVMMWEYDPDRKKGKWSNADPHNSLNNLPVNFIIHQKGTDNRLYIGTDAGVWVKDENKDVWEPYGDFPNVRVTAMKANYCNQALTVGTWGRSVWTGNMLPMLTDFENELKINMGSPVYWTRDRVLDKNLVVKSGAILKIDDATVSMPANGKITVEPGGTLVLNNSTIKNNCDKQWQGIIKLSSDEGSSLPEGRIINLNSFVEL